MLAGDDTPSGYTLDGDGTGGGCDSGVTTAEPIGQAPGEPGSDPGVNRSLNMECLVEEIRASLELIEDSVYKLREEIAELHQLEKTFQVWTSRDLIIESDNLAEIVQDRVRRLQLYEDGCKKRVTSFRKVLLNTERECTTRESDDSVIWYQCLLVDSISDYQLLCSIDRFLNTYENMNVDLGDAITTLRKQKNSIVGMLQAVHRDLKALQFTL